MIPPGYYEARVCDMKFRFFDYAGLYVSVPLPYGKSKCACMHSGVCKALKGVFLLDNCIFCIADRLEMR